MGPQRMDRRQLEAFAADGVVLLPGFVTLAQLAVWREQAWAQLDDEFGPGLSRAGSSSGENKGLQLTPSLDQLPQVNALIRQLGGGRFTPEVSPNNSPPAVLLFWHCHWSSLRPARGDTVRTAARARDHRGTVQDHPPVRRRRCRQAQSTVG